MHQTGEFESLYVHIWIYWFIFASNCGTVLQGNGQDQGDFPPRFRNVSDVLFLGPHLDGNVNDVPTCCQYDILYSLIYTHCKGDDRRNGWSIMNWFPEVRSWWLWAIIQSSMLSHLFPSDPSRISLRPIIASIWWALWKGRIGDILTGAKQITLSSMAWAAIPVRRSWLPQRIACLQYLSPSRRCFIRTLHAGLSLLDVVTTAYSTYLSLAKDLKETIKARKIERQWNRFVFKNVLKQRPSELTFCSTARAEALASVEMSRAKKNWTTMATNFPLPPLPLVLLLHMALAIEFLLSRSLLSHSAWTTLSLAEHF